MTWLVLGLVAAMTSVIITGAARWSGRRRRQRVGPGLLFFLVCAASVAGFIVVIVVRGQGGDHRRCVETATLTVVPPARCQGAPASEGPAGHRTAGTGAVGTGVAGIGAVGTGVAGTGAVGAGAPAVV